MATDYLVDRADVERRVGLTRSSIYAAMRRGDFPIPVRVGPKAVRWRSSEIEDWMNSRARATGESA